MTTHGLRILLEAHQVKLITALWYTTPKQSHNEESMKSYRGSFKKMSGELRNMHFAKLSDLPNEFISARIKGGTRQQPLTEGLEVVWDLENQDFRIFNWKTVEGAVKEEEVNFVV